MKTSLFLACLFLSTVLPLRAAPDTPPPKAFRLVFKAYDGDPWQSKDYSKFSFQIDTVDLRQPSEFLQLGQMIPNTKLRIVKFVFKEGFDEKLKEKTDLSELTVENPATKQTAVLPYNKVADVSALDPVPAKKDR